MGVVFRFKNGIRLLFSLWRSSQPANLIINERLPYKGGVRALGVWPSSRGFAQQRRHGQAKQARRITGHLGSLPSDSLFCVSLRCGCSLPLVM